MSNCMGTHTITILDSIRTIVRQLRVSSRSCEAKSGLSSAQIFVLRNLKSTRPLSINELAAKTFTHQSTVSEVVSRLVDKDLVSRRSSKLDGRRLELVLTATGRSTLTQAPKTAQEALAQGLSSMTERKRGELALLLSELLSKSGFSTDETPPLFFEETKRKTRK